jgi:hypothetical protein
MKSATCRNCQEDLVFIEEGNYWEHLEWGWQRCPADTSADPKSGTVVER